MAGLLEGVHEGFNIGRRLAGRFIIIYHLHVVVDSDGGKQGSGNSGGGRLTRMCMIKDETAR